MVVIAVALMITVIAIPVLAPALRGRQIREASRELTGYLAAARTRALQLGRPVGVWIERFGNTNNPLSGSTSGTPIPPKFYEMSVTLFMAETPPPYAGDTLNARMVVVGGAGINGGRITQMSNSVLATSKNSRLIRPGDLVKLGQQGRFYIIQRLDNSTGKDDNGNPLTIGPLPWRITPVNQLVNSVVPSTPAEGVSFQIFRQPTKSLSRVLQLPGNAVIDLQFSGLQSSTTQTSSTFDAISSTSGSSSNNILKQGPVIITFQPDGSLGALYNGGAPVRLAEPVYLLVGKREKVGGDPAPDDPEVVFNFQDPENVWVAIGSQSGLITSTEMAAVAPDSQTPIQDSRLFARQAQNQGGR